MVTRPPSATEAAGNGSVVPAFAVLHECHRQTLAALDKLPLILAQLEGGAADGRTRSLAAEVVGHFSATARQHHEDEELHVFPKLATSADPVIQQAVLQLQQDHHW